MTAKRLKPQRARARVAEDRRLWHGGVAGLRAGELLLPPVHTGVLTRVDLCRARGALPPGWLEPDRNRPDRVYLTSDRELARAYAFGWGTREGRCGALYVAQPLGPSWPDPDHPQHSIECERAVITAVYDPAVIMSARRYDRIMMAQVGP